MSRVTELELCRALSMSNDGGGEAFELVPATETEAALVVTVRPAKAGEYLMHVVRRVKGERARFLRATRQGVEEGLAQAKEADGDEEPRALTSKEVEAERAKAEQAAIAETMLHVENQIDGGPESMAALSAICIGFPGNETVEKRLIGADSFIALHEVAHRLTHAQPGFHDAVSALIWGAKAAA